MFPKANPISFDSNSTLSLSLVYGFLPGGAGFCRRASGNQAPLRSPGPTTYLPSSFPALSSVVILGPSVPVPPSRPHLASSFSPRSNCRFKEERKMQM